MHLCFRRSFDDVTRNNFRFRLLVTWSSAHGRVASSCKIWCRYLYPMRSYWHFAEIKDGGRRHLGFVGGSHGTTHEGTHGAYSLLNFRHDRISSFQVIKVWNFCRLGLKVLFTPPKFDFFCGVLPPKFRGTLFRPTKGTSLRDFTSFELSGVKIHPRVWPVRVCDVYVGGKVRVAKFMIFLDLQHRGSK